MHSRICSCIVAALAALALPSQAHAQSGAFYGVAETSGDNTTLFLLGGTVDPGKLGWQPYGAANVYNIRFDNGPTNVSANVFAPSVGLKYANTVSATQFGVGYAFSDQSTTSFAGGFVPAESGEGVFVTGMWNHWGTGRVSKEVLGSYGLKSNFLWSRAGMKWRLAPESPLHVGGEVGLLGSTDTPSRFTAQVGPAFAYHINPMWRLNGGAGLKMGVSGPGNDASDWYARVGFLLLPWAK